MKLTDVFLYAKEYLDSEVPRLENFILNNSIDKDFEEKFNRLKNDKTSIDNSKILKNYKENESGKDLKLNIILSVDITKDAMLNFYDDNITKAKEDIKNDLYENYERFSDAGIDLDYIEIDAHKTTLDD